MKYYLIFCLFLVTALPVFSQQEGDTSSEKKIWFNGSLQSEMLLFGEKDEAIDAEKPEKDFLTNTYFDFSIHSKYVEAGARLEYTKYPLPGYEPDFADWGVPYFYATGTYKNMKLTVGDFYEQFGSGLIFRTYYERSLGVDNALRGGRFLFQPYKGINIKLLGGKQRYYYEHNKAFIWGGDAEFSIDQWSQKLQESGTYISLGASFVSKHEKDEWIELIPTGKRLNLPEDVGAFAVRGKFQKGNYSFMTEYALKANDPSFDNGYIYKNGSALLISGSYSKPGLGILLQAKRSDNMSFRSKRSMNGTSSFINHLPAFTNQQTYALATIYPYATQIAGGEWAFQGEVAYTFKKGTALGGKYGTRVKLNVSHVRSIDKKYKEMNAIGDYKGTDGYSSSFFKMGPDIYFQDINFGIEKRFTKDFTLNLLYMNLYYDMSVIKQEVSESGDKIVKSNIFVAEGKYKINNKLTLRGEVQYLQTKQDLGDWWYGLMELSVAPSWMFTVSDMYNSGEKDVHYYMGSVVFTKKSHRLLVGYGRTRDGYDCSGGVCRYVPATKGFRVSYNFNF